MPQAQLQTTLATVSTSTAVQTKPARNRAAANTCKKVRLRGPTRHMDLGAIIIVASLEVLLYASCLATCRLAMSCYTHRHADRNMRGRIT